MVVQAEGEPPEESSDIGSIAVAEALEGVLGVPFTEGNRIQVLKNGDEIFPAMLEAIESAQSSINFLTFVYWKGDISKRVAAALASRARAGVKVRVLLDAFGAWFMSRELLRQLREAGAEVIWFRPLLSRKFLHFNNRTHRKVLVVDDHVAFTGGVGIASEWEGDARNPGEWRDTHFRIEGPAVHGLQGAFFGNWLEMDGPLTQVARELRQQRPVGEVPLLVLRTSATVGWSDVATVLQLLISLAQKRLHITTAYFVPDETMVELLCQAARRGVQVEIICPGPHADARSAKLAGRATYRTLLGAGIEVWEYQPTMLHAKIFTIDGNLALLGSANFNQRSMRRDDEVSVVVNDPGVVRTLDEHFETDRSRSERINLKRWKRRGTLMRLRQAAARLFSKNM